MSRTFLKIGASSKRFPLKELALLRMFPAGCAAEWCVWLLQELWFSLPGGALTGWLKVRLRDRTLKARSGRCDHWTVDTLGGKIKTAQTRKFATGTGSEHGACLFVCAPSCSSVRSSFHPVNTPISASGAERTLTRGTLPSFAFVGNLVVTQVVGH